MPIRSDDLRRRTLADVDAALGVDVALVPMVREGGGRPEPDASRATLTTRGRFDVSAQSATLFTRDATRPSGAELRTVRITLCIDRWRCLWRPRAEDIVVIDPDGEATRHRLAEAASDDGAGSWRLVLNRLDDQGPT